MKSLYLLRHAKSSWDDPGLPDHDRPLAPRGRRAAPAMGAWMATEGLVPDLVLCSSSARTRETWDLMAPALGEDVAVEYSRIIYHANGHDLLDTVRGVEEGVGRLLVIGHAPSVEALARRLAAAGPAEELARMHRKYPTCALAVLAFDVAGWRDIPTRGGTLERFVRPRDLR